MQVTITLFYVSILLWKWEARCSGAAIYFIFYMILKRTISSFSIEKMSVSDFLFMKGTNFAISSCQIKLMYKDINYRSLSLNTTLYFLILVLPYFHTLKFIGDNCCYIVLINLSLFCSSLLFILFMFPFTFIFLLKFGIIIKLR